MEVKKYDYTNTEYTGFLSKIKVKCNECGQEFITSAQSHSSGHGCRKCSRKNIKTNKKYNTETFVKKKAISIHGDKFDYSGTIYESHDKKSIHSVQ